VGTPLADLKMEESLRDLLEGLGSIAVGAANNHDKPANIVGEVKELLEYLAEDELPAASAIFLAKVSCIIFLPHTPGGRDNKCERNPPNP